MRLSDAIALGRTLIEFDPNFYYREEEKRCVGCAIGMGLAAMGKLGKKGTNLEKACEIWPWLGKLSDMNPKYVEISDLAFGVEKGHITMDELIDRVRAMEPTEPEIPNTFPVPTFTEIEEYSCT